MLDVQIGLFMLKFHSVDKTKVVDVLFSLFLVR